MVYTKLNPMSIVGIILIIIITIALFIALREVCCWYFKINSIIDKQKKMNFLLTKILVQLGGTLETESTSSVKVEDINTYDYLDDQGKTRNVTAKTAEKACWTLVKK